MKENFIFRLRQEKGWTQSELARILSVSEKKLAKWENGVGFPNVKTFELLIRVSGKTLTELLGQGKGRMMRFMRQLQYIKVKSK